MAEFAGAWTESQVGEFLTTARIPIRVAVHRGDGSLWMVALWYRYHERAFECATPSNAALVKFLQNDSAVAFDVSTNDPPYRGVRGRGRTGLSTDESNETLRALIERYLEEDESSFAERLLTEAEDTTRIRIRPNNLFSWDYSD